MSNRDPVFDGNDYDFRHGETIDDEIAQLHPKPGYLERLLKRVSRNRYEKGDEPTHEPPCHAGESLAGRDFSRRQLINADFRGADLCRSNFTGAMLDRALFCDAAMIEAILAEAMLTGADLRGADLSGANLIGADFSGADLRGANLQGSYLWGADFEDADLMYAKLDGAYAGGSIFSNARNLSLEQFRSTIHDETGAYRLSMLPGSSKKEQRS